MKNQLGILQITLLRIYALFLIGLATFETIIIILDLFGYENQVKSLVEYLRL